MNQQPLEIYDAQAVYACGMKLFHRAYAGPLLSVTRHNDDVEVNVYPDATGKVTLNSPIEAVFGVTESSYLGEFLCVGGYTSDPVLGLSPVVSAGVNTFYDQSSNINHLVNADTATQPLICDAGNVFFCEWGLSVSFQSGRYIVGSAFEDSATLHYRVQFDSTLGAKYLYRQDNDAFYAKITDAYLDEAVGSSSVVVFNNENYYRDYTTYNIDLTLDFGTLLTLEVEANEGVLTEPPSYKIENIGLFYSVLMYSGTGDAVRRHVTNITLAEDITSLAEKFERYNPQSYYNIVAGAKALFSTFSFAGLLGPQNTRLMRLYRSYSMQFDYCDVLVDNTGYITLNSTVNNHSDTSSCTLLGEWVAHSSYNNPDGIPPVDAYIDRVYSQINETNFAQATALNRPKLYESASESLVVASSNGTVGLRFYEELDDFQQKVLQLETPIYAKTVVVVYANYNVDNEINVLTSAGYGPEIFSKFTFEGLGDHGVTLNDAETFNMTEAGLDTELHVVALYEDAQKLVIDGQEYDITYDSIPDGIEGTELEDMAKWKYIGASSGAGSYVHKGYIAAVIYYDDDKYEQKDFINSYLNTLFGIQNVPTDALPAEDPVLPSTLLTDYPGAAVGYSLRLINPDYTGNCIRVRRSSDNAEINVGFNSLKQVDSSALIGFSSGGDVFVTTWYDQSGAGNDAVQATAANQPQIVASGSVLLDNGMPAISYDSTDLLEAPLAIAHVPLSVCIVQSGPATQADVTFDLGNTASSLEYTRLQSNAGSGKVQQLVVRSIADSIAAVAIADDFDQGLITMISKAVDDRYIGVNGSAFVNLSTSVTTIDSNFLKLGGQPTETIKQQEIVVWTSNQSANRADIEKEINGYYGIYEEGLLADYSGAAAAYALRQLNSAYEGYCIRVRRASDGAERDIAFDGYGNIDVVTLETFCSGTDGFVSVWYDQSGNGNDAVQATTSAQPKVYDSVTGVVTDNGTPSTLWGNAQRLTNETYASAEVSDITVLSVASISVPVYRDVIVDSLYANNDFDTGFSGSFRFLEKTGTGTVVTNQQYLLSGFRNRTANTTTGYANGTQVLSTNAGTRGSIDGISIGQLGGYPNTASTSFNFEGHISELILYPSDQSTNRPGIESNINNRYQLYWDGASSRLLDEHSGAAAAYSLRTLNSQYTGPLIRVRRASDNAEQDITATYIGNLDVATLDAFCSGTDGFVAVWYDQSGAGNDAVQATTSAQPQVYGSATGVVVDSLGKPRLDLTGTGNMVIGNLNLSQAHAFVVFEKTQLGYYGGLQTVASNEIWGLSGKIYSSFFSPVRDIVTAEILSANTPYLLSMQHDGTVIFRLNTSEVINTTRTFTNATNIQLRSASYFFSGYYQELVIYNSVKSSPDTTSIESNINGYYGIYAVETPTTMPVIEGYQITKETTSTNPTNLTIDAPSGIVPGELLLIITSTDVSFTGLAYDTPSGWTKIYEVGNSSVDTYGAAFYKIADGTEGASQTVTFAAPPGSDDSISWYIRVSGVDTFSPVDILGQVYETSFSGTSTAPSVTTTSDNCLVFAVTSFDGGDGFPMGIQSGVDWPTAIPAGQSDYHPDTGFTSLTAGWLTKEMSVAGVTEDVTFSYSNSDGSFALQFAIKGA